MGARLILSLGLILSLCWSWTGYAAEGRRLYLSIGIDRYQDPYWGSLRYAEKDAQDMAKALDSTFDGGSILATSRQEDGWVSRADILKALDRLALENDSEADVVIIYLSGHGTIGRSLGPGPRVLQKYVVTSDADASAPQTTALAHAELLERFARLKSRRKVLILDTCFSGVGKSRITQKILDQLARQKGPGSLDEHEEAIEGSIILAASAWSEEATESSEFQNALYTHFLIEGLEADLNRDGAVTITEAHAFATRKVIEASEGRQHPSAHIEIVGSDPIVIRGQAKKGPPLIFAYEKLMKNLRIKLNGSPLGDVSKGGASVPAGYHTLSIQDQNGKVLLEKVIRLDDGREYPLSHFLDYDPEQGIRAGLSLWGLAAASLQDKVMPQPMLGAYVGWRHEGLWPSFNLDTDLHVGQQEARILSQGERVRQRLTWFDLGLHVGQLWSGSQLRASGVKRDPDFHLSWFAGPDLVHLQREIEDASFYHHRQRLTRAGFTLGGEIGWEHSDRGFQIAVRPSLSLIDGGFKFERGIWWSRRVDVLCGWIF